MPAVVEYSVLNYCWSQENRGLRFSSVEVEIFGQLKLENAPGDDLAVKTKFAINSSQQKVKLLIILHVGFPLYIIYYKFKRARQKTGYYKK